MTVEDVELRLASIATIVQMNKNTKYGILYDKYYCYAIIALPIMENPECGGGTGGRAVNDIDSYNR